MAIIISTHPQKVTSKPFIYYPIEKCASSWLSNITKTISQDYAQHDNSTGGFSIYDDHTLKFYEQTFGQIRLKEHKPGSVLPLAHTLHYYYSEFFLKNAFQFTFVRNPLDRFVSAWVHGSISDHIGEFPNLFNEEMSTDEMILTFNKFVDSFFSDQNENSNLRGSPHFGKYMGCLPKNIENLDFIGKLENFNSDLEYVINTIWGHKKKVASNMIQKLIPSANRNKNNISEGHNTRHYRNGIPLEEFYSDDSDALVRNYYREEMEIFGYD